MAMIQSSFLERTSPCSLKSTWKTLSSICGQSSQPVLCASRQLKRVDISCEVMVRSISLTMAMKVGSLILSFLYLLMMALRLVSVLAMLFWILRSIFLTYSSTEMLGVSYPAWLCLMSGCQNTCCQLSRLFSSITRLRTMKSRVFSPIWALQGKRSGMVQMPLRYSSRLLQGQGVYPNIISQSMSPRLQMSDCAVQGQFLSSWGAMQMGVPQISVSFFLPKTSALQANPKSATLCTLFFTSTLAGLMSLWMYPSPTITWNPFIIWSNIYTHSGSVIFLEASSFLRSLSHSSSTMQVKRWPILWVSIWTEYGDLAWAVICISPSRAAMRVGSRLNSSMFMDFIAQNCWSLKFCTLNTFPQLPYPRNTLFFQSQSCPNGNSSSNNISQH